MERTTRFVLLLHLPDARRGAEAVRDALIAAMSCVPAHLRRSLTWDQGKELALHADIARVLLPEGQSVAASQQRNHQRAAPAVRPEGTDLAVHNPQQPTDVSLELNGRLRKTLNWETPTRRFTKLLTPTK